MAVLGTLLGCSAGPAVTASSPDGSVTLGDSPAVAQIEVGGTVEVRLPAQFGTGFRWIAVGIPAGMTLAGESIAPNGSTLDGRRDIQVIRLRGEKPGHYEVRFVYRRPFEPDAAPARTVTHRIEVRRGP